MAERFHAQSHRLPGQRGGAHTVLVRGQAGRARPAERARHEGWQDQTIIVMRNDLTVIRGQAQLMKRALELQDTIDTRETSVRLDAIIAAVDQAGIELQRWQASRLSQRLES